jgi:hypothetical protein
MKSLKVFFLKLVGNIDFTPIRFLLTGKKYSLTQEDHQKIKDLLSKDHFVILIWRASHLTSYLIAIGHFLLGLWVWIKNPIRERWPTACRYSHALNNLLVPGGFTLFEAIAKGVVESSFEEVFNCDRVCILEIPNLQTFISEYRQRILVKAWHCGYDFDFNPFDSSSVSCAEYDFYALSGDSRFEQDFEDFHKKILKFRNLDPQMFRDSTSFRVVLEI